MIINKKGISLIVLVITIIVMIILAGAVILSLDNAGIIDSSEEAVEKTDLKQVQYLASLKWSDAFLDGKTTQEELEEAVVKGLEEEGIKLSEYEITVTEKGVDVAISIKLPNEWKENVTAMVDGVPIPKGFVASGATGENTKNGGLVIYEGTEAVTDTNVEDAKRERNQYVWVPVPKNEFVTKFVRQSSQESYTVANAFGTSGTCWEVVLDLATNMPLSTQDANYVSTQMLKEVQEMYASVKEYGGFYIARYEAGIDAQRTSNTTLLKGSNVYSMMGKIPYTYIQWGNSSKDDTNGAVEVARSIYPDNSTNTTGVISTLTYGVQWDRTLAWWLEVGAKDINGNTITATGDSTSYGNYYDHVIASGDLNDGAQYAEYPLESGYRVMKSYQKATSNSIKESETAWALSTGALKAAKVNNIYDMAGNMTEWTMEACPNALPTWTSDVRVHRGGHLETRGSAFMVVYRNLNTNGVKAAWATNSFRTSLYIKL